MPRGGSRKPANPSPVSGPGALSRRTDGGPADKQPLRYVSGMAYGEGKQMMETQAAAPMSATPQTTPSMPNMAGAAGQPVQVTPLGSPTGRPAEPVTSGADAGAGPGMASLGLNQQTPNTGKVTVVGKYLPILEGLAAKPDAPDAFRAFVQAVKANVDAGQA